MTKAQMIEYLVSNSPSWGDEGDDEVLNSFPKEKLIKLVESEQEAAMAVNVANSAMEGFEDEDGNAFRLDEEGQWLRRKPTANAAPPFLKGKGMHHSEDNEDGGQEQDSEGMEGMDYGNDDDEDEDDTKVETRNRRTSMDELPPDVQERLRVGEELERKEKMQVINVLLADADPETRKRQEFRLLQRTLPDLQADVELLGNRGDRDERSIAANRNGRPRLRTVANDEDMLTLPGVDGTSASSSGVYNEEADIAEEIKNLSPKMRSLLTNARHMESKEKGKLIDRLVANCGTEREKNHMRNILSNRDVDDLRVMARLAGSNKGSGTRQSFVGNNPGRGGAASCDPNEDVLLPTSMNG